MRYRSDVVIMVHFEDAGRISWVLAMARLEGVVDDEMMNLFRTEGWLTGSRSRRYVRFESVKWYGSYDFADKWRIFLEWIEKKAVPESGVLGYEFMRIGEDDTDIEYESGGLDLERHLWLSREIVID